MRRDRLFALLLSIALVGFFGTLAVTAGDDDGGLPALPVLGAGGEAAGSTEAMSDMALARAVEYRVADDVPDLGGSAPAWRFEDRSVTDAAIEQLAQRLGVDGGARRPQPQLATVEEGGRHVSVFETEGLPWNAGPARDSAVSSVACVEPVERVAAEPAPDRPADRPASEPTPTPTPSPGCEPQPEPPRPSEAEAERVARDFWETLGFEPGGHLEIQPGWGTVYVAATPLVGGVGAEGMQWSVAVAADGRVEHANGWLGEPVELGEYPLVGVRDAVRRLTEENGRMRTLEVDVADDCAADACDEPMLAPEDGGSEPVVVTIVGAEPALQLMGAYLVPSYRLETDAGYHVMAIAVDDEHLAQVAPVPHPEPVPGDGGGSSGSDGSCVATGSASSGDGGGGPTIEACASVDGRTVRLSFAITDEDAPVRDDCGSPVVVWGDEDGTAVCELACVPAADVPREPSGTKRADEHTYDRAGTYTITVTGESNCGEAPGGRVSASLEVTVE